MDFPKKTKKNWLLIGGIVFYSLFILLTIVLPETMQVSSRMIVGNSNLFRYILLAVIVVPLLEELTFRGIFTEKKFFKVLSLIALPVVLFLASEINWVKILIVGLYYILILFHWRRPDTRLKNSILFTNAIIFSVLHWQMSDFMSFQTIYPILAHFGLGLLLLWTVLNFSLLKAMLFHAAYNFLLMFMMVVALQFPNEKVHQVEAKNFILIWEEVPVFNDLDSEILLGQDSIFATNGKLQMLTNMMKIQAKNNSEKEMVPKSPFSRYNIQIYLKNTSEKNLLELYPKIKQVFRKEKLIF